MTRRRWAAFVTVAVTALAVKLIVGATVVLALWRLIT
jgi:hypothetical protein